VVKSAGPDRVISAGSAGIRCQGGQKLWALYGFRTALERAVLNGAV